MADILDTSVSLINLVIADRFLSLRTRRHDFSEMEPG